MKLQIKHLLPVCCLFLLAACNKDFLEKKPLDAYSDRDVWNDPSLTQAFVNDMYSQMRHGYNEVMLSSMTDESRFIHNYGTTQSTNGAMSPDDIGAFNLFGEWNKHYTAIRNTNLFFEKIGEVPFKDESLRNRLRGETHFLRAYFYHMLVKYWGGVPLITKSFGLKDKDMLLPRSTFEECVKFIADECDSAAKYLPEVQTGANRGRATKYAALALKSRFLLYAASDLFNRAGTQNASFGYVGGDRVARWTLARNAAKAIIDSAQFDLYKPTSDPVENYTRIFMDKDNVEAIFVKYFHKELLGTDHDKFNGPNGYHNWGGNVPLENFVEGYQMADGTPFDRSNPAHAAKPYVGRDPRFYATILYDGAPWKKRATDGVDLDPIGQIQTGRYEFWNAAKNAVEIRNGLDTRQSSLENWNGTYSGYYLRKFMDISLDAQFFRGDKPWQFFRYAEILLNYAEACIALGQEDEARTYINRIRTRAGMPALAATVTGQALVDAYRYERRYELAFEEHRYFDARRWLIATTAFTGPAKAIDIYAKLGADKVTLTYTYTVLATDVLMRNFQDKHYLLPIQSDEMRRDELLKQNPGY
ncbi:RagB/SusD family nutrient uptake outer membrane protein [Chitinophaga horti]|uniref:RagB/SusD family nutrient uptake outer membrane protein n=1 Tax=Chitinophaga horti TaxID=2920382 RepID=A0ABY6IZT0_9BACT|nr:RagB/SusD family nutrient uptake outer membrane protein [Chitinophaga horti]UYQ92880.1 RagB/SusD family nutrient uptake outer membrane protein [Chitinophaga horti]